MTYFPTFVPNGSRIVNEHKIHAIFFTPVKQNSTTLKEGEVYAYIEMGESEQAQHGFLDYLNKHYIPLTLIKVVFEYNYSSIDEIEKDAVELQLQLQSKTTAH